MSGIETLILASVKSYASKQIIGYAAKVSWKKLFPNVTWEYYLRKAIAKTIDQFRINHPYQKIVDEKYPFYASQILFENLTSYVLFSEGNIESISSDFHANPNVIIPSKEELKEFYDLFYSNVKDSKILTEKFIDENYKQQIFVISESLNVLHKKLNVVIAKIESIEKTIGKGEITTQITIQSLNNQAVNQLKAQSNSGKYLKSTFVETGKQKDYLRYACDSIFFLEKIYNEIKSKDFRYINDLLLKKGEPQIEINIDKFIIENPLIDLSEAKDVFEKLKALLERKKEQIEKTSLTSSNKFTWEIKLRDLVDDICFLKSKIILITETAGQGKTNFLCDLSENFLLKRQIPTVLLTGIELNASDIRTSILKRIFPERSNVEFIDLLTALRPYCNEQKKFFVIIIDGINESLNSKKLSKNLELFINDMLEYDFVKIVLSCRTEYFDDNFKNLETGTFKNEMNFISSLIKRHHDRYVSDKLFNNYFEHFKIRYKSVHPEVKKQLTSNFLLLRIFSEAFRNQDLGTIDNIYKQELFENYYVRKITEINERLITAESGLKGKFDIRNFINKILELMITNKVYSNIPIEAIAEDGIKTELLQRFLDENLLIKRDLDMEVDLQIFKSSEVVNFTFDEFRDFLISRYLIEIVYSKSVDDFQTFLAEELSYSSAIMEGCSTFLFYKSKKSDNNELKQIIQKQDWYESVFSKCIFNIKDVEVTHEDKELLKKVFTKDNVQNTFIIRRLINRRNFEDYKNLNLDLLIDIILDLNQDDYDKYFIETFGSEYQRYYKIDQDQIIDFLEKKLPEIDETSISYHKFFELLIYMMTNEQYWLIEDLYERYHFKFPTIASKQLKRALETKNINLKETITNFLEENGISI